MKLQEEGDTSSNPESQDSEDSPEASDGEVEEEEEAGAGRLGRLAGLGGLGAMTSLGGLHIKVEHYGEGEEEHLPNSQSSSSEEEQEEPEGGLAEYDSPGSGGKVPARRKRRKAQKWDDSRTRRLRISASPSPMAVGDGAPLAEPSQATPTSSLLPVSPDGPAPSSSSSSSSVLKIKTEMAEPINFDNDSSIWNYPPNREISRNESPFSMTSKAGAAGAAGGHEGFPPTQGASLQVSIPDSVLTPPGTEGGVRKLPYNGSSAPSSASSLAPPSSTSSADPLSPPLSASPRDKQQGTPTAPASSASSLLYSGELEALQRLQAGNVVLPLVHRVAGGPPASTASPRVYTTGTIRYAPADVTLAMAPGNLLPNSAMNFVDSAGFLDPKTPMEMLYHHVHRLNMSAAAAASPFVGSPAAAGAGGSLGGQVGSAEGLFSTLPFPVYSNGLHSTPALDRKED